MNNSLVSTVGVEAQPEVNSEVSTRSISGAQKPRSMEFQTLRLAKHIYVYHHTYVYKYSFFYMSHTIDGSRLEQEIDGKNHEEIHSNSTYVDSFPSFLGNNVLFLWTGASQTRAHQLGLPTSLYSRVKDTSIGRTDHTSSPVAFRKWFASIFDLWLCIWDYDGIVQKQRSDRYDLFLA